MDAIFKKLNYKAQKTVFAINTPDSFEQHLLSVADTAAIIRQLPPPNENIPIEFAIAFATQQKEVDSIAQHIAPQLQGDAVFWVCYPKGSSKRYKCDFNRDTGWAIMGYYDLEPVRMVAIDEDWSALRFRKVQYIKTLTRQFGALSEAGKEKAGQIKGE